MKPKVKRMALGGAASGAMLNAAKTAASSMKKLATPVKDIGTGSPTTPRPKGAAPSTGTVTGATMPRPVKPGGVPVKDIGTGSPTTPRPKGVASLVGTALGAMPRASMFKKGGAVKKKTTTKARKK
jgi:hypothetical protein